jgi:hypothetical protein
MKPPKKITRIQLKISSDDEAPLIGIVTAEPDYKLSLTLNRIFGISLRNSDPVEITDESGIISHFSRFEYTTGHHISYSLISNRSENEVLIKKHPKIDYFFRINSDEEEVDMESITATLRSVGSITAVFVLNRKDIKDKNIEYLF